MFCPQKHKLSISSFDLVLEVNFEFKRQLRFIAHLLYSH